MPKLKKTIITPEIEAALSTMLIDGDRATLTGQLDRKLYMQVDAVLEALGGTWTRGTKDRPGAHVFTGVEDLAEAISRTITSGKIVALRDLKASLGWFATPGVTADALVDAVDIGRPVHGLHTILEPSAGEGALIEAALRIAPQAKIIAVEIDLGRAAKLREMFRGFDVTVIEGDFVGQAVQQRLVKLRRNTPFHSILMNPPFCKVNGADHLDHVGVAISGWMGPTSVLGAILPASITSRQDRRHVDFRARLETQNAAVTRLPSGSFKASKTSVETVMVTLSASG